MFFLNVIQLLIIINIKLIVAVENDIAPDLIITTNYGKIQGKTIVTERGSCNAFIGVPFAAPPVAELRWRKPQAPVRWEGIKNATQSAPACIQSGSNATNPDEESEDCLYLNVITPKSNTSRTYGSLPVMVYIYGGGFINGSARKIPVEGACENLVLRDVVVVILQYRLGLYGFLSTGDSNALGNYAIWDQIEALKWVKENIAHFGANSNKVTLFGNSAGGASVSYLTYTPIAKDLFQYSISQSGSALSFWAKFDNRSMKTTTKLAEAAKCPNNTKALVDCLRHFSTIDLQRVYNAMNPPSKQDFLKDWSMMVDGELFDRNEYKPSSPQKSAIIGVNKLEMPLPNVNDIPIIYDVLDNTLNDIFPKETDANRNLKEMTKFLYIDSKGDQNNRSFVCQQTAMIQADLMFHVGSAAEAESKAAANQRVWVYNFEFYFEGSFKPDYPFEKGAIHAHELCFLFLIIGPESEHVVCPNEYTGNYRKVANYLGEMWTNFAKTGNPSPSDITWPQFHNVSYANALEINNNLTISPHFYLDVSKFWNYLVPKIEKSSKNESKKNFISIMTIFSFVLFIMLTS